MPRLLTALAGCLSAIEASLLDWEDGKLSSQRHDVDVGSSRDGNRFAYFFGKARVQVAMLNQRLDDAIEDGDDILLTFVKRKTSLPLLKDLPLDPSTLCKTACSFANLRRRKSFLSGGDTLERVALRLMTAKAGRLLSDCPISDLVRLCSAIATSDSTAADRERVGLFVRRLICYFNKEAQIESWNLKPLEIATLHWSLGELGVKFYPGDSDLTSAHRRLHLFKEIPLVKYTALPGLPDRSLAQMVGRT